VVLVLGNMNRWENFPKTVVSLAKNTCGNQAAGRNERGKRASNHTNLKSGPGKCRLRGGLEPNIPVEMGRGWGAKGENSPGPEGKGMQNPSLVGRGV